MRNKIAQSWDLRDVDLTVGIPETNRCVMAALTIPIAYLFLNQKAATVVLMDKSRRSALHLGRAFGDLRTTAKGSRRD